MNHEMLLFLCFLGNGILLAFVYSVLQIFRALIPHARVARAAEDVLFGIGCGVYFFCRLYRNNDGIVRFYVIAAALCGIILWKMTAEPLFIGLLLRILEFPVKCLRFLIKRLLFLQRSCRILIIKGWKNMGRSKSSRIFADERIRKREKRRQQAKQNSEK